MKSAAISKKPYIWVERAKVISALRRIFRTYPAYQEVLRRCKNYWFYPCKNGNERMRVNFKCESCGDKVDRNKFAVDHTSPVLDPTTGFVDYNTFVSRLFCPVTNLTGMCKKCHDKKSKAENAQRRLTRKENKK